MGMGMFGRCTKEGLLSLCFFVFFLFVTRLCHAYTMSSAETPTYAQMTFKYDTHIDI